MREIQYNWKYSKAFQPVFDFKGRYIALTGGRACVDGETKIATPSGEIKIKDFKGGLIYSFDGKKRIITYACKPTVYKPEDLYTVKTDKKEIIVTANHRFLTDRGWVKTNQLHIDRDNLVCVSFDDFLFSQSLVQSTLDTCLLTFEQGVRHYLRTILGFLYYCLQDYHLCDVQLLRGLNTYLDVLPLLNDVMERKNRILSHMDDLDISYIYDLTYQFYNRFYSLDVPLNEVDKNYTDSGNYIYDKFFVLLSGLYRAFLQFREKNNHLLLIRTLSQLVQGFYNDLKSQDKIPQTIFDILLCDVHDNSFSNSFLGCNLSHHYIKKEKVLSIEVCKKDKFYDFYVPFYNCYIGNGIINHNSGKSWFLAHYFLDLLLYKKADLLCAREFQNSISESNYKLFKNIIDKYDLPYDVQSTRIKSRTTGSQIVFIGLSDVTADNVKSFEDFKFVWLEEAQKISKKSWETLNPTIRTENAQIFISMNPEINHKKHPIMSELLTIYKNDSLHLHINYNQNPFVSSDIVKMAELTRQHKPDDYRRIWLGIPDDTSVNTVVKHFTEDNIAELTYCPDETLHITCDFNVGTMMWCLAHVTANKVFFFDEIVLENVTTEDTIQEVIRRYPDHKGAIIINGDAAGTFRNTQSEIDNYKIIVNALRRHYPKNPIHVVIRPSNPRIKHRITVWNNMVLDPRGQRRIIIDPKCKWLLYNMEELKYKPGTDIIDLPTHQNLRDDNEKRFLMHIFDAASYLVERYFLIKPEGDVVYSDK